MSPSPTPARHHQPARGAALLALSALFFALMGVFIREATLSNVNNEMVVFFRNAVGVLFFLPLALTRGLAPLRTQRPWAHLKRTLCGLAAMYCYFYALAHLPLTDAMLFSYAHVKEASGSGVGFGALTTLGILFGQYLTPGNDLVFSALYRVSSILFAIVATLLACYLIHRLLNRFEATRFGY